MIFFDELDALAPRRSDHEGSGGASARVVNQLLTEMDGIDTQRDERGGVHIMAATNRPDMVELSSAEHIMLVYVCRSIQHCFDPDALINRSTSVYPMIRTERIFSRR